jgi:hypothetical protein
LPQILDWLSRLFDSWKFWIVIPPWDAGVRVRFGNKATALRPGFHFRLPFLDAITIVNTRLRIDATPPITVHGGGGRSRYLTANVGFKITDPLKAMMHYGLPGPVVLSRTQVEMSRVGTTAEECLPRLREYFHAGTGVEIEFICFIDDIEARAYRLLSANGWVVSGHEPIPGQDQRY